MYLIVIQFSYTIQYSKALLAKLLLFVRFGFVRKKNKDICEWF